MRYKTLTLCMVLFWVAGISAAHQISSSRITVAPKGNRVEVQHTIPAQTAHNIVKTKMQAQADVDASLTDEFVLSQMATAWHIASDTGACVLKRQAFRRIHHDTELIMRYLFECPGDSSPVQIRLPWLMSTPQSHFIAVEMITDSGTQTKLYERQDLTLFLPSAPSMPSIPPN